MVAPLMLNFIPFFFCDLSHVIVSMSPKNSGLIAGAEANEAE